MGYFLFSENRILYKDSFHNFALFLFIVFNLCHISTLWAMYIFFTALGKQKTLIGLVFLVLVLLLLWN